ncbi:MAG: polyphosphate kinase [Solirubrobacteraceae bacterium]|nr:polyphosphate kinase [Solirubrobacteraceae bacterium]
MAHPEADLSLQEPIRSVEPAPAPAPPSDVDLHDKSLYFGRELSWMDFNDRVLQLVEDETMPLLERVKLAAIWSSNLDEFFQIRVAGVHDQIDAGLSEPGPDGLTPSETIDAIREGVLTQQQRLEEVVLGTLLPGLAAHGLRVLPIGELSKSQRKALGKRYRRQIFPVLTPLAVGHGRPFPYISSLSLSLAALVCDPETGETTFARVKVPTEMLDRFVEVDDAPNTFVALEEVIAANLETLFPGMEIAGHGFFRVIRDADFEVSDEADDLLQAVEAELRRRRFGEAVRLEVDANIDPGVRKQLRDALDLEERQVYDVDGLLGLGDLWQIYGVRGFMDLRDPPWTPVTQPRLQGKESEHANVMAEMRRGDVLVHHPYDSFATSVERFVEQAVADPDVLAIKMTVYRTSEDSSLFPALIRATERGKQAVCMVELKARFDERANIGWARALEQAGVHVVYGYPGLKTHAKCILVVRREGNGVRHYVHVGTGNYHPKTARLYTDFGLFTCDEQIGSDVADMFNSLTGIARPLENRKVLIAPHGMRDGILEEIDRTIAAHEAGDKHARIRMKLNSLVDRRCIRALYRASQAGVDVALNVRGICCLRPGVEGTSENITVTSVLGRFLEHSRIYSFEHNGEKRVLIGSADLMPRNLDTRVELITPVEDRAARDDLLDTLDRSLATDEWAWELGPDGAWRKRTPADPPRSVQRELMRLHAARASEGAQAGEA